jgi:tripartite-type tricarboxylate transporter receptor subunit TctC
MKSRSWFSRTYNLQLSQCIARHLTPGLRACSTAAMRILPIVLLLATASAAAQPGYPSDYPTKPVRMITGAPPGTPADVIVRIIAEPLGTVLGQPLVVENRPGAINTIGLGAVAKAHPDGHTLGTITLPSTLAPHLLPKIPFDTARDLAPVRQLAWVSNVLVVRPAAPFGTVRELVAAAKARPQALTFASGGNGTPAHVSGELFRLTTAVEMRHVPYNGVVAGVAAVMGEHVDMMFAIAPAVIPHLKAGKLRALATPAPSRLPALPELPTLAELGYAVDVRDWVGIIAPAETPKAVILKLEAAVGTVLGLTQVKDRVAAAGFEPAESNAEAFGGLIRSELQKWGRVVNEAGIKPD